MRLMNADKLETKHFLQRSEYPIGYEGTQPIYKYTDILAYDIESAETVEAIPIEFIEKWLRRKKQRWVDTDAFIDLINDWEKENEQG